MCRAVTRCRTSITVIALAAFAACGATSPAAAPDPNYTLLTRPGKRAPANDLERAILTQLARLSPETATTINGAKVVAGAPYSAASGRTCRSITVHGATEAAHLACRFGKDWSFVPVVVRTPAVSTTPEVKR